jgi:hypothetical protein
MLSPPRRILGSGLPRPLVSQSHGTSDHHTAPLPLNSPVNPPEVDAIMCIGPRDIEFDNSQDPEAMTDSSGATIPQSDSSGEEAPNNFQYPPEMTYAPCCNRPRKKRRLREDQNGRRGQTFEEDGEDDLHAIGQSLWGEGEETVPGSAWLHEVPMEIRNGLGLPHHEPRLEGASWLGTSGWAANTEDVQEGIPARATTTVPRRRRATIPSNMPMLDNASDGSIGQYSEEEEEGEMVSTGVVDKSSVNWIYRDETWSQDNFKYDPEPIEFTGFGGPKKRLGGETGWALFPTFMQLFKLFWPDNRLKKIVVENNRYARVVDAEGKTKGGPTWENITVATLKAFIAIFLYFGMKRQPNEKSYWYKVSFIIPFNLFFIQRLPHK